MEWICTVTFKIRVKIEVEQHFYRFRFKLSALPHPDGLLMNGSVLHLTSVVLALILGEFAYKLAIFWWFLGVADTNDIIQKIEKTLNNTHTTTQKLTNNSFRNTKKHPIFFQSGDHSYANMLCYMYLRIKYMKDK